MLEHLIELAYGFDNSVLINRDAIRVHLDRVTSNRVRPNAGAFDFLAEQDRVLDRWFCSRILEDDLPFLRSPDSRLIGQLGNPTGCPPQQRMSLQPVRTMPKAVNRSVVLRSFFFLDGLRCFGRNARLPV